MWRGFGATVVISCMMAAPLTADVSDRQTHTVALPQGKALAIDVTIGNVRIEGWDQDRAEVVIERHAPTAAQFARIPLAVEDTPSRVSIRAVQPEKGTDPAYRADVTVR